MKWFRYYDDALDDPKVQRLHPAMFKHWVNLLCLASKGDPRGALPSVQAIAFRLRVREVEAESIVTKLCAAGLLDRSESGSYVPHNWIERQRSSDDVATRVRAYRQRHIDRNEPGVTLPGTLPVSAPKRTGNGVDRDREGDRESISPNGEIGRAPDADAPDATTPAPSGPTKLHPALAAYKNVTGKRSLKESAGKRIVAAVGDAPAAVEKWRGVLEEWIARGYRPENVAGMLEWFRDGIPAMPHRNGVVPKRGPELPKWTPPHDLAAEQAVLGGCLLGGMHDARPVLRPEDFYRTAHSRIYAAMCRLDDDREPVDFLLLAGALQKAGHLAECGGEAYLTSLLTSTPTAAHTAHYAQLVADAARARRLIAAGVQVTGAAYDGWEAGDMDGAMDRAARLVMDADQRRRGAAARPVSDLLAHYYDRLDALSKGELPSGVSTGFTDLDKATGGWQPSDLIILAARPGMGKTSLLMAMAEHAASLGVGVLLFSLEMGAQALTHRLVSRRAQVDGHRLRLGLIRSEEWGAIHAALGDASELPLWVDDSAGLSVMEVRARARRLHQERPLGLIGVDYLQLMSGTGKEGNREQEIAGISRGLKALARELNVPVVVGAQLNRQAELRTGEKPLLSHLRESGQIEQDADVVLFLWRSDETPADLVDVSISKHRNGPLTDFRLTFQREHTAFRDHGWKHEGMMR